jgi:hypothetical protein
METATTDLLPDKSPPSVSFFFIQFLSLLGKLLKHISHFVKNTVNLLVREKKRGEGERQIFIMAKKGEKFDRKIGRLCKSLSLHATL